MKRASTAIGIVVGFAAILLAQILDHGSPASLFNLSALVIIVLGTLGASLAATSFDSFRAIPKGVVQASFKGPMTDLAAERERMLGFARKARKEGILKLESAANDVEDDYLRRGIGMVVDGVEPETLRDFLALERKARYRTDTSTAHFFETAGGFSPTLGIIGTVVGLVSVLSNISNMARLAPSIATAFTATLWGIVFANIFWLPIAMRLRGQADQVRQVRELQSVGLIGIAEGESVPVLTRRMDAMLAGIPTASAPKKERQPKAGASPQEEVSA